MKKVKTTYSYKPANEDKAVKAAMKNAEISYKNTHQTVTILKGMFLVSAIKYLDDVLAHNRCIPMKKYNGGIPRTAQAKEFGVLQGRWPEKSVTQIKSILKNMQSTATSKGLDISRMKVTHTQVNRAPIIHNRTYRAHGRVTAWNKSPCHIELIAEEELGAIPVEKPITTIAQKRAERRQKSLHIRGQLWRLERVK
ncbi:large subunit ribosomal protein L17e [Nematocida displodere]|uniref:Large subunit ribosomal protein L17e n=1 Tax=Nematocida displodere TaxID=1805483 RepID=A0A177EHQ2_9MICR|nr:large subunit ribosomal protein L17e [Nematocida displodere]